MRSQSATRPSTPAGRCTGRWPTQLPVNPTAGHRPVMTVIYFGDGARVSEPADDLQPFDLAAWLKGLAPGGLAASARNPLLFP